MTIVTLRLWRTTRNNSYVKANALLLAASGQMLAALKAVDVHLIAVAMNKAKDMGYTATWEQVELMFGVSDMHAEVRQAITAAEGGR